MYINTFLYPIKLSKFMTFFDMIYDSENLFMNLSFCCLLLSTILYWFQTFLLKKKQNLGTIPMFFANFCLFTLLMIRWKNSGHFPLSNLYESFIFLSWTFTSIHLILERYTQVPFLGAMTSPSALLTNAFANFCLPADMQQSSPLVPALQSNWLMMHVTVMILSYAALICGSLLSIAFLILNIDIPENQITENPKDEAFDKIQTYENNLSLNTQTSSFMSVLPNVSTYFEPQNNHEKNIRKIKLANVFDHLSYRILGLGFPFLTIGILSGAVWANEAWGSYWSWDPKETWALLTWLVFAIYLHTRLSKGWTGKKPARIASFGFFVVWICYLGVNLMGEGLHSYGWIHS